MGSTSDLANCPALLGELTANMGGYPTVKKLLNDCPYGTLMSMSKHGAIVKSIFRAGTRVSTTGSDNRKSWTDYLTDIQTMLHEEIVKPQGEHLTKACTDLGNHIHSKHYAEYPRWPDVNDVQSTNISIRMDLYYSHNNDFVCVVVCGSMSVTDERPAEDHYIAKCEGTPDFKVLKTQKDQLAALETAVARLPYSEALGKMKAKVVANCAISIDDL